MSKEIRLRVPKTFPHHLDPVTVVNDEDYEFLNQFQWYAKKSAGTEDKYHAARGVAIIPKKNDTIRMHRLITEARHDAIVYHINGNTLDNRRGHDSLLCRRKEGHRGVQGLSCPVPFHTPRD